MNPVSVAATPDYVSVIRKCLAEVIGPDAHALSAEDDLFAAGIDSLRSVQFATLLEHATGRRCNAEGVFACASIRELASYLDELKGAPRESKARPIHSLAPPAGTHPLIRLRDSGEKPPLFCVHPAGGRILPYVPLKRLLAEDQPLYALQSRALSRPPIEHLSVAAMATDYATLIQEVSPAGPYRLLGWSFGGVVAHAIAVELERRQESVDIVWLIDCYLPDQLGDGSAMADLWFALTGIARTHGRAAASADPVLSSLARVDGTTISLRELYDRYRQSGALGDPPLHATEFEASVDLYRRHFQLYRRHLPARVNARIGHWSVEPASFVGWRALTARRFHAWTLDGDHFSIMTGDGLARIASDINADAHESHAM